MSAYTVCRQEWRRFPGVLVMWNVETNEERRYVPDKEGDQVSDKMKRDTAVIVGLLRDSYQDAKAENDRLKAENKQLRELVTRALAQHLSARYEFESTEEYERRLSALLEKMRELGIEVGE